MIGARPLELLLSSGNLDAKDLGPTGVVILLVVVTGLGVLQRGIKRKARVWSPNVPLPTMTPASLTPVASFRIQPEFAGMRPLRSRITPPLETTACHSA